MAHMTWSANDNHQRPPASTGPLDAADEERIQARGRRIVAAAEEYRGRADLLDLALETRASMLRTHLALKELNQRCEASTSDAERASVAQEMSDLMVASHLEAERFEAMEAAMDAEARSTLWRRMGLASCPTLGR